MVDLVDSYPESNYSSTRSLIDHHPSDSSGYSALGQSFTCGTSKNITSAKFYMKKTGSPTGNGHAVLYDHAGIYGSSSLPTGSALATSDDFDVSTLTTSYQLIEFTFTGAQQYVMQDSTYYCIIFENPATGTINSSNYTYVTRDSTSQNHSGNGIYYRNSGWSSSSYDSIFYVYGEAAAPPVSGHKIPNYFNADYVPCEV